jgi:capsular exopolysaccharide synthesis family protein
MSENKLIHMPRSGYPEIMEPANMPYLRTDQDNAQQFDLMTYWQIIVSRRRTILAILVTVVTATMIWSFKQTPIYRAETTVQIDRENPDVLSFKDIYDNESTTDDTLRTQFEVLKSRSLARRVIEELRLADMKEFQSTASGPLHSYLDIRKLFRLTPAEDKSDPLSPIIDEYLRRLAVSPVRLARLASVTFESEDPELAAKIVNTHARDYVLQNLQYKWNATKEASDFLAKELVGLKSNLEKAEDQLQAYSRKNQILFTDEGSNTAVEKLQQLELEHTKAEADRVQKESFQNIIESGNSDALPQLTSDPLVQQLLGKLSELRRQEAELSITFRPDYPARERVHNQINELEKQIAVQKERLVETIKDDYAASAEREKLLVSALEGQRDIVNKVNQDIIQYNILKREADSNKQLYDGLLNRLKQAEVSAGLSASNIRIVDRADSPKDPVRPRKLLYLSLSVLLGLLGGIGVAFAQESFDDSVKSSEDVARYFNAPTLGIVPRQSTLAGKHAYYQYGHGQHSESKDSELISQENPRIELVCHEEPSSILAEAYRSIRTSLLVSSPDRPPKIVLVTSTVPGEGKTTTATNMAVSLTQTQSRVVLIDCDMRKPRVHDLFNLKGKPGLSSFLTGMSPLKEVVHETQIPNLFVIPCGVVPPNPGELIVSNRFRQLLQTLAEYFDYVILDSPPISNVSDARVLAANSERTVLVVKAGSTPRRQVHDAAMHLIEAHAQLAGVVLNDLDFRSRPSYYSYSASYYAAYGNDSKELTA